LGVVTGPVRLDMAGVARRKRQIVAELVEVHLGKFKASGAELGMGEVRFTESKTVQVTLNAGGTRLLRGERVFINVGTRAYIPDVPGLALPVPLGELRSDGEASLECKNGGSYDDQQTCAQASQN
jgi:pyruvate/2-oxoglutarate dehydrogenase complex dihydrolipoamide dehydrogenase (E3) component